LVNTVQNLNEREIGLKVLAGDRAQIDTTTSNGRLIFDINDTFRIKKIHL
jgi:DNA invertase Pin-like site-specific DNA recombinase